MKFLLHGEVSVLALISVTFCSEFKGVVIQD